MSDPSRMNDRVSHSTPPSSSSRVLEQRNLLGGLDLLPVMGSRKRARQFHVSTERKLGFAAALALVVEHGREKAKETGTTSMTRCPRCGHTGPTEQDFGFRIMSRGQRRPQSWCRGCRGQHLEPTVNTSAPRPEDGWLFPPETVGKQKARPDAQASKPKAKKRARSRSNDDLT
ncbi:hypothetical protein D7V97_43425 [Corallococcus sp. CA053C]|uniref:hypothetical protein n=1 Tax=Corallococcus sp. CA053C TaxID=2316732 RepID=UPI000EA0C802|nr:hypothetical protein [Corallococcus sp. CA053C]RKG85963.1 hypothetical protein D7V97_43425 [Corallococcus sp. CA053C]